MENKKTTYTIDEIEKMNDDEWNEFRKIRWSQKQETYQDENNLPDWFWPAQREKDNVIRQRAWAKKCRAYSQSKLPADWFIKDKKEYIDFLKKIETRKKRSVKQTSSKK